MALQYSLVFGLLAAEMVLFAVISLPLPSKFRRPLLKGLGVPFHSQHFQIFFRCMLGFILVLFVDSLNRMWKVTSELSAIDGKVPQGAPFGGNYQSTPGTTPRIEVQTRRFYAQRNVYLCGMTLFLSLIVKRTYDLVFELLAVKEEIKKYETGEKVSKLASVDGAKATGIKKEISEKDDMISRLKKQAASLTKGYAGLKKA